MPACEPLPDPVIVPEFELSWSFEDGMDDWVAGALGVADSSAWSVAASSAEVRDGARSLRFALDAEAGGADLWIGRALEVAPGRVYDVEISFWLATADHAGVASWTVLAGAHGEEPASSVHLVPRDGTGSGLAAGQGFAWVEKRYTAVARADEEGLLWVTLGVRSASGGSRVYFLDGVRLILTRS